MTEHMTTNTAPSSFADQLWRWRERVGLSQSQAARVFHMPTATFQRYEHGNRLPAPWVQSLILDRIKQNPHPQQK